MATTLWDDKILLIPGGTGSFGHAVVDRLLSSNIREIRILSRDEKKQDDMRKEYDSPKLKFFLGDVRDASSIDEAFSHVDYVFHAAALKQVPSCERFPLEAVKTNILGSDNVITACLKHRVKKAVFLSTDKAVYPTGAMGMTKALMEKDVIARSQFLAADDTVLCLVRYGNMLASRGSVVPLFLKQIQEGKPLTITNPKMTRFMMTLEDAVDLALYAFEHGKQGDLFVHKAPAVTVQTLAEAILHLTHSNVGIRYIGSYRGEKEYETLVTSEEREVAEESDKFFHIPAVFAQKHLSVPSKEPYTSQNTILLDGEETCRLLKQLSLFGGNIKQHE